jgi:hypothetical protein
MNSRRAILTLWMASAVVLGGGGSVALMALLSPVIQMTPSRQSLATAPATRPAVRRVHSLQELQTLWNLDLQRPLYDPPPVLVTPPVVKRPPLTVRLLGTIVEPGNSVGVFRLADGREELRSIGQDAGGAEVLEIHEDRAVVRYHGEAMVLQVQQEGQGP